ncbi:MAG: thioredoxin domain-containing protein [Bowdeniella nasicola]|nr:thioredoxin domain-containing protein [Bowdeniella nasicola]
MTAPQNPDSSPVPAPARSPLVIVLLVLLGMLLVGVGFFIGRLASTGSQTATPTPAVTTSNDPGADSGHEGPAPETSLDPEILELVRAQVKRDPDDPFARGEVDAPVVMVEYSDFSCPFCAQFATQTMPELEPYIAEGTLRVEWRDLALFPEGQHSAAAAHAAAQQGKFWEFHDLIFADHSGQGHPSYDVDAYVEFARQAGVSDLEAFRADVQDDTYLDDVRAATDTTMMSLGLRGTPAFIINDQVISGAQPLEVFIDAIESQKP